MKKLLRILAAAILGAGLVGGVAGASSAVIDTTGPDSFNEIEFEDSVRVDVDATNNTNGSINTDQDATSGDASVRRNTNAGGASTGNANNSASTSANVSSNNGGVAGWANWGTPGTTHSATLKNTGPDSVNEVEFDNSYVLDVNSTNNTNLTVGTSQAASTGNANVSRNTNGGSASTGHASNTASSSVVISSNN